MKDSTANPRDLALLWVLAAGASPEDAVASLRNHGLITDADHLSAAATRDAAPDVPNRAATRGAGRGG